MLLGQGNHCIGEAIDVVVEIVVALADVLDGNIGMKVIRDIIACRMLPRLHVDLVTEFAECLRQIHDVDIQATGGRNSKSGQGTRPVGDHSNLHMLLLA